MSDEVSAELGLKFANNEVCYPATLIVGDIIKALKSGRYDLNNTAVVMSQERAASVALPTTPVSIKRAMISNGFQDIPLLTLGVTASTGEASGSTDDKQDYNEQDGFECALAEIQSDYRYRHFLWRCNQRDVQRLHRKRA